MKIPKKFKDAVDASDDHLAYTEFEANTEMPTLERVGALFVAVRDDIAKTSGAVPEDVKLIGVRVIYVIGEDRTKGGHYYAFGNRDLCDPEYTHLLQELF